MTALWQVFQFGEWQVVAGMRRMPVSKPDGQRQKATGKGPVSTRDAVLCHRLLLGEKFFAWMKALQCQFYRRKSYPTQSLLSMVRLPPCRI